MKHRDQVLSLLETQVSNPHEVDDIRKTAEEVVGKWIDPLSGGKEETNGLIYGLVQSGKTGVLTVTAAMGADAGYRTIIILTSDNDPLYEQTLSRARAAFPGMDILGKQDIEDVDAFLTRIRANTCAIVITKNTAMLSTLNENFQKGKVRGLSCLLIDDEADQASLNTRAKKPAEPPSPINAKISQLRAFFQKNTYLQVTATPQALFLQQPGHAFRPTFTVLSHPGADYVGGDAFFGDTSKLVREFDPQDILVLAPGAQPAPAQVLPASLVRALDTFMIGATFKRLKAADQNCAFLCHVSTRKSDHGHIVDLLLQYKTELARGLKAGNKKVIQRLRSAYDDLATTHKDLAKADFDALLEIIAFLSPGISVKLVNGETDEDVAVESPYNLFVGGNKLGRGVTIKNLLVSYYGRHPRAPQSDTVLQHARMYGYRRRDLGLLRLFLTRPLHNVFRAIHRMEGGLRELIGKNSSEQFRGIYIEGGVSPTRKNVLAPGAVGVYTGGGTYNPAQIVRKQSVAKATSEIDQLLEKVANKTFVELPIATIQKLVSLTMPDPAAAEKIWDAAAVAGSLEQLTGLLKHKTGYVYVDRDRGVRGPRRETQGILEGGEAHKVPKDKVTVFILRQKPLSGETASWWPQVRFPDGSYAFAFAI